MRSNFNKKLVFVLIFLALGSSSAFAQTYYTVSGTVISTGANPIAGVQVLMYNSQGDPIGQYFDSTDAAGFYAIASVLPGDYGISFRPNDDTYAPEFTTFSVTNSNVTINMTLQYGNILSGYIRDSFGVGLEDIDLNIYDQLSDIKLYTPSDNSNAEGFYDVVIPDGLYRIAYRSTGNDRYVPLELENVSVTADTAIDVVMEEGYFISGTVTGPGGLPVADADLDAENALTGMKIYTPNDNTDLNGEYQLLIPPGTYNINVSPLPQTHILPGIQNGVQVFADLTLDFELISGFVFSGTVRDSEGSAVYNVDLNVEDAETGVDIFTPYDDTDSSGLYQIALPAGLFDVAYRPLVEPPYLAPHLVRDLLISGDTNLDITLYPGLLLSGVISNNFDIGVANVDIDAVNLADTTDVPLAGDHTDSLGQFTSVIQPGVYNIEIEPPAGRRLEAKLIPNVELNNDTSLSVSLDTAMMVSGTVTDTLGTAVPYIAVTAIENGFGEPIFTPGNQTDSLGFYGIFIHPGTYDIKYQSSIVLADSLVLHSVVIAADTVINIVFENIEVDTVAPAVTLVTPNGGEIWQAFSTQPITWNASDNYSVEYIDLFFSTHGLDGPFAIVAGHEQNDGIYFWQIPYAPSENAIVKIVAYDVGANSSSDFSDSPFIIEADPSACVYVPGDANNDGAVIGSDVTFLVNYFRGNGPAPPVTCWDSQNGRFNFAAADANGDCQLIGSDITFLVNYFRQVQPAVLYCPFTPPSGP